MARCLRCYAGNEWIEGNVKDEPSEVDHLRAALKAAETCIMELISTSPDLQERVAQTYWQGRGK
jgi:tRNA isopentenyl-2-thiomethyl-A-37 hydroxylase MiaE